MTDAAPRADTLDRYKRCLRGDLIINRMRAFQGALGVAPEDGLVSPDYAVLRAMAGVDPRFIAYALRSPMGVQEMVCRLRGIGGVANGAVRTPRINIDDLLGMAVVSPPPAVQTAIADCLDRECERIAAADRALAQVGSTVEELTRTEFEHLADRLRVECQPRPLKRLVSITGGFAFDSAAFVTEPDLGVRLIRGTNVGVGVLRSDDTVYWPHDRVKEVRHFLLREGDLLVGLNRPWITGGLRTARVDSGDLPALLLQRVACLRPVHDAQVDLAFVQLLLNTDRFRREVGDASAVTFPMLEPDRLMSWQIPMPPIAEQRKLVATAAAYTVRYSRLRVLTSSARMRLAEYRDALITESIAGQFDVTAVSNGQMDERAHAAAEGAVAVDRAPTRVA